MGERLPSQTALSPSPPEHAPAMPSRLGRYELISELAKGGMGAVYLARTRGVAGFERLVVVKCALPSLAETTQQMLLAEAKLAASLQHTNIVQVHDVDTDGTIVFLAMEFLHGQDARHLLRRSWGQGRPLSLESELAIGLAVCAGLHYAHEKRDADGSPLEIVHRDISPSNVFVTYDGSVKLIDFGIAKATALPSETQLGSLKGKPGYMSPEQVRCEPLDRRSDVFCLGILLYELTVGRKPFRADNEYLLHKQIIEDDPPRPTTIDPAYPAELEAIVMRALAKDRRDRQPTALAVQEALTTFASAHRLDVSQFALGRVMSELFSDELAAWHLALRAGESLVDHVIKRTTSTLRIIDDGGGATGTGDPRASAVTPSLAETTPERPAVVPRRRRRWLAPVALGLASTGIAATIALWPAADGQRSEAHDRASEAPASERVPTPTPTPTRDEAPVPTRDEAPVPTRDEAPTPTRDETPTPTRGEAPAPTPARGEAPVHVIAPPGRAMTPPGSQPPGVSAPPGKLNAKPRASNRRTPGPAPDRPPQDPAPTPPPHVPGPDDLL